MRWGFIIPQSIVSATQSLQSPRRKPWISPVRASQPVNITCSINPIHRPYAAFPPWPPHIPSASPSPSQSRLTQGLQWRSVSRSCNTTKQFSNIPLTLAFRARSLRLRRPSTRFRRRRHRRGSFRTGHEILLFTLLLAFLEILVKSAVG